MKKFFVLATALVMAVGASKAAEKDMDVKASNTTATTTMSMADMMKENQILKLALLQSAEEKETLEDQANYAKVMHAATTGLYEQQVQQDQEMNKLNTDYAWMMHNVILNLNALNAAK